MTDAIGMGRIRPLMLPRYSPLGQTDNFSRNPDKLSYAYLLTPSGIEAKARLSRDFLARRMREYDRLRDEIEDLRAEVGDAR